MSYIDLGFNENLSVVTQSQQIDPLAFDQFTQEISGSKIQGGQFSSVDKNLTIDLENNLFSVSDGGLTSLSIGKLKDGTLGLQAKDTNENTTFSIDGITGSALFKGEVQAGSILSDTTLEGGSINIDGKFIVDNLGRLTVNSDFDGLISVLSVDYATNEVGIRDLIIGKMNGNSSGSITFYDGTAQYLKIDVTEGIKLEPNIPFSLYGTATPDAPADTGATLYVDQSGGKDRLMVRFNTGASQQIAIEP